MIVTRRHAANVVLATILIVSTFSATGVNASEKTSYGEPLSTAEVVRIGEVLADPERYLDQKIKVAGLVDDICPMKGCWVDILEQQSSSTLRFQVEDDVIIFPVEAKGSEVVAEGVLRKHEMTREQAVGWLRHLAEEKGEDFEESSVTGPMTFYRIEGLGAEITAP